MRLLIIDDHEVIREGVGRLLRTSIPHLELFSASDASSGLDIYRARTFDLVVIDLAMPDGDGFSLIRKLQACDERVRILVFSMNAQPADVMRALRLGAHGFVSKSAPAEELIVAVTKVAEGARYLEKDIANLLAVNEAPVAETGHLTDFEDEILRGLGDGKTIREIAILTGRSYKTVSNRCVQLRAKLGLRSLADLVRASVGVRRHREEA
jgi:DNA-binding NarL/FixJ family response regulator